MFIKAGFKHVFCCNDVAGGGLLQTCEVLRMPSYLGGGEWL